MRPVRIGGLDGELTHPIIDSPTIEVPDSTRRRAQLQVARRARSADDCALLLDMLGIGQVG